MKVPLSFVTFHALRAAVGTMLGFIQTAILIASVVVLAPAIAIRQMLWLLHHGVA